MTNEEAKKLGLELRRGMIKQWVEDGKTQQEAEAEMTELYDLTKKAGQSGNTPQRDNEL